VRAADSLVATIQPTLEVLNAFSTVGFPAHGAISLFRYIADALIRVELPSKKEGFMRLTVRVKADFQQRLQISLTPDSRLLGHLAIGVPFIFWLLFAFAQAQAAKAKIDKIKGE
jgi:hypothetical protein